MIQENLLRSISTNLVKPSGQGGIRTPEGVRHLIYSQTPLATWVPVHISLLAEEIFPPTEADDGNRTHSLPLTRRLLYR